MSGDWVGSDLQDAEAPPARATAPERPAGRPEDQLSPFELVNAVLQSWRLIAALMLGSAALVTGYWALLPPTYSATVAFVPEVRSQSRLPTGLAGLVGQFGISLGAEATQSPRFYAAVIKGRELMERILLSRFPEPTDVGSPDSVTLLQTLGVRGRSLADSLDDGLRRLDQLLAVRVDNLTNIVRVSVDARYAALVAPIANRFVAYLNEFNAKSRQSQARARRQFVEERVRDAEVELRRGESALKTFYERNRSWQESPQLVFEEGQLRRQVDVHQEVHRTLRREYETARIEEVNDTPVITVIEAAAPPARPTKTRLGVVLSLALVLSGLVGVLWAVGRRYVRRAGHQHDAPYREFVALRQQAGREIGAALRALAPRRRR